MLDRLTINKYGDGVAFDEALACLRGNDGGLLSDVSWRDDRFCGADRHLVAGGFSAIGTAVFHADTLATLKGAIIGEIDGDGTGVNVFLGDSMGDVGAVDGDDDDIAHDEAFIACRRDGELFLANIRLCDDRSRRSNAGIFTFGGITSSAGVADGDDFATLEGAVIRQR